MLELIFFIFIIYMVYKKYNHSPSKIITILQNKGFSNISTIRQNIASYWITATFHGDNYLFEVMKPGNHVSNTSVHALGEYALKTHYHNVILIPGNSIISSNAKPVLSQYKIQIWDHSKVNDFSNQDNDAVASSIMKTYKLDDTCKIDTSDDPIQDGIKANSILGNFFGNKVDRL